MPSTSQQTKKRKKTSSKSTKTSSKRSSSAPDASLWDRLRPVAIAFTCLMLFLFMMRSPSGSQASPKANLKASAAPKAAKPAAVKIQRPRSADYEHYIGYASDLMEERVHKGSSTDAIVIGPAKIEDYVFEYSIFSNVWKGGVADLVEAPGSGKVVWGLLYEFPKNDIPKLDRQKGIGNSDSKYRKVEVVVTDMEGYKYRAFTYIVVKNKREADSSNESGVKRFEPSIQYRMCIVNGARTAGLPKSYVSMLEQIPDNGEKFKRKSVGTACDWSIKY